MLIDSAGVSDLVELEMARITDPRVASALRRCLVTPSPVDLLWDYGEEGETYPGYVVAEFPNSGTGIAFSEHGWGPSNPWILIGLDEPGFGIDTSGFATLEGAFRDSWEMADQLE